MGSNLQYDKFLNPVRIAQKRVARAMTFSEPTAHSSPLFHDLKLLNFYDLRELLIAIFVYECHNNFAPSHFRVFPRPFTHGGGDKVLMGGLMRRDIDLMGGT